MIGLLLYFFGKYLTHPNAYIFNQWGDGVKNYFTPAWYVEYDSGNYFSGMLYPFGEHVVYTDNQPAISWIINFIDDNIYPISKYTIGIINSAMLLSLWLCAILLFKILIHYKLPKWYAVFAAIIITFMNPQLERIAGHYALSYCFYIPLLWWLSIQLHRHNYPILRIAALILLIIFFGFIHLYYLLISVLFFFLYACIRFIKNKKSYREFISNLIITLLPVIIIFIFLSATDPVKDRPSTPYGFYAYRASFQSVFLPRGGWVTQMVYRNIKISTASFEGYAYIGFAGVCVAFASLFIYVKRSIKNKSIKTKVIDTPDNLSEYVVASVIALLFSMALPFTLGLDFLLDIIPFIKQFRSPGRFAWIFYFVFLVYTVIFLFQATKKLYVHRKIVSFVIAIFFAVIAVIECKNIITNKSNLIKQNANRNPFDIGSTYWTSVLLDKGYAFDNFQAVLFVPFFLNGSEKLYIDRSGYDSGKAMEIAYHTGLPLINSMSSRTSISRTLEVAQIVGHGTIKDKPIKQKLSEKNILLITTEKNITSSEKYLLNQSTFIGQQANIKFYSMPVTALQNTQHYVIDHFMEKRDSFFHSSNPDYYAEDSLQIFYTNDFDDLQSPEAFIGTGSLYIEGGKKEIAEIPVNISDTIWVEISFWAKTYIETTAYPYLQVCLLDENGKIIKKTGADPKLSADIVHDWVKGAESFDIPPMCKKLVIEIKDAKMINIDNVLLRHTAYDVFYGVESDGSFLFNNYPIGK
ncbi:MAG: hypothetical protein H7Y00_16555 [Fimbriimonadaceae bacterium]|nr:hypothetical protein [Chitinophagales bacterium]